MSTILGLILDHQWFINSARTAAATKKKTMPWSVFNTINLLRYKINPIEKGESQWSQDQASSQINNQLKLTSGQQSAEERQRKIKERKIITMAA